jgi:hypothetical protein
MNMMCFSKSTATGMHFLPLNELIVTLALGAGLGFFGGLFGIGGGIIAIPLLVLGFGMEQPLAQGTALVLMVPNLLVGWWRYNQRHPLAWRQAALIGMSATLTTWLVAHFAARLDPDLLRQLFSIFIGVLALRMLRRRHGYGGAERPLKLRALPLVGMAGGSSMGLLGIGGGLVATPLLSGWLGSGRRWRKACRWRWWSRVRWWRWQPMPGRNGWTGRSACRWRLAGCLPCQPALRLPTSCRKNGCAPLSPGCWRRRRSGCLSGAFFAPDWRLGRMGCQVVK